MRKLKLYNYNKTSYIDFDNNKYLVTDISGLGTSYEFKKLDKAIYDIEHSFENTSLTINFGINSNAYNDYKSFLDFIISNGKKKFILGYDYGLGERFTDVYIKNVPKKQKTNFNIITENAVFDRLTPWYEEVEVTSPGDGNPFELDIVNNHIMPIPLILKTSADEGTLDLRLHYAGEFSRNLLIVSTFTLDRFLNVLGDLLVSSVGEMTSDYIPVIPNTEYTYSGVVSDSYNAYICFYDSEKTFIGTRLSFGNALYKQNTFTTISNAYFMRISNVNLDVMKLERGDKATEWSPAPEDFDSEVGRLNVSLESGYSLLIDSENKKVEFVNSSGTINGYDNIDHTYNTFLHINRGAHVLKDENGLPLKIKYKKWVAD